MAEADSTDPIRLIRDGDWLKADGTTLGGLLMNAFGWRPVFVLLGALSVAWLWPWRG